MNKPCASSSPLKNNNKKTTTKKCDQKVKENPQNPIRDLSGNATVDAVITSNDSKSGAFGSRQKFKEASLYRFHESRSQSDFKRVETKLKDPKSYGSDGNSTPLIKKQILSAEKILEENPNDKGLTKTPPAQACVSPEIQCDSSIVPMTMTTPTCYGAGPAVSGMTDKRKCRSRGILAIGDNNTFFDKGKVLGCFQFDDCYRENVNRVIGDSDVSVIPMPTEASVHWHLSPKESSESNNESCRFQSPEDSTILCSPENQYNIDGEISPFSLDSLGSGNVIRTPQSDSSTDKCVGFSWLSTDYHKNRNRFDSELNFPTEGLQMTSLSPNSHASIGRQSESSFHFESLSASFNSIDLTQFQRALNNDKASWTSSSTMESILQSQMKISWREEGSESKIQETGEFDCCVCISDEEDERGCSGKHLKSCCHTYDLNDDSSLCTEAADAEKGVDEEGNEKLSPVPPFLTCLCAESISTVGESICASRDSDWSLSYSSM